jgi:hypothetical protein
VRAVGINSLAGALCLALALGGCATTQQGTKPAPERSDAPNPGAQLGAGCARIAIEGPLRGGLVVLPITTMIAAMCLPAALGVGVLHAAVPGLGAGVVADTGPAALRKLSDEERSAFPQSWAGGCAWGSDCYSHPGANKGPVEMNRLTEAERSAFPQSWAGGCAWGSDCYSYQGPNKASAEMRKLTYTERSVFPRPFAAGCVSGYGC